MKRHRIAPEVKEQILKRVKVEGIPVVQAAKDHGISEKTIYQWLSKGVLGQPSWKEVSQLKKENQLMKELIGELTMKLSHTQKKK